MDKIITNDNSVTLFNEEYQETYHSKTGAIEETFKKFIEPTKINELAKSGHIRILDVCFGLGYNAIGAIDSIKESNPNCEIEIISLEKDLKLDETKELGAGFKNYQILNKLEFDPITNSHLYEDKNIHLIIKIGDATKTIKKIQGKFDAIFHDPFSPKKNPEMWSKEFFIDVKQRMTKNTILATYSCARMVRDNLRDAGFEVQDGPKVGRRGPSTVAHI